MSLVIQFLFVRHTFLAVRVCMIAINDEDITQYIGIINRYAQEHPILVDKYL